MSIFFSVRTKEARFDDRDYTTKMESYQWNPRIRERENAKRVLITKKMILFILIFVISKNNIQVLISTTHLSKRPKPIFTVVDTHTCCLL